MIIDLSDLKETGSFKELKSDVEFDDFNFRNREIRIEKLFFLDVTIYNTKESFVISGSFKGEISIECSRCLQRFPYDIEVEIEQDLKKDQIEDLENVNLQPILKDNILLAIPIKPLCSEECKGICPECGQNLNKGECDCDTEKTDPRLAKLKDYFDKE